MKKNIFGGIAILVMTFVAAFNMNLSLSQKSNIPLLTLANIEALASEGVEQCDIFLYNRNAKEKYVLTTVKYNAEIGLHASIGTRIVKLALGATVGGSVGIPDCVSNTGNCCKKSFINNSPVYY